MTSGRSSSESVRNSRSSKSSAEIFCFSSLRRWSTRVSTLIISSAYCRANRSRQTCGTRPWKFLSQTSASSAFTCSAMGARAWGRCARKPSTRRQKSGSVSCEGMVFNNFCDAAHAETTSDWLVLAAGVVRRTPRNSEMAFSSSSSARAWSSSVACVRAVASARSSRPRPWPRVSR